MVKQPATYLVSSRVLGASARAIFLSPVYQCDLWTFGTACAAHQAESPPTATPQACWWHTFPSSIRDAPAARITAATLKTEYRKTRVEVISRKRAPWGVDRGPGLSFPHPTTPQTLDPTPKTRTWKPEALRVNAKPSLPELDSRIDLLGVRDGAVRSCATPAAGSSESRVQGPPSRRWIGEASDNRLCQRAD
eukprot:1891877-Rhodomonas_salina.3